MAVPRKRRHYRSRVISIITSAINVSIETVLLESWMNKASVRLLLLLTAIENDAELRYDVESLFAVLIHNVSFCQ